MRHGRRVAGLATALTATTLLVACGSSSNSVSPAERTAADEAAAASAAATAAPGTYGAPVNPSLPNPTNVATDAPVAATTASASGGTAPVVVTYSGWVDSPAGVEVGAYVAGVAESGGTCTLTLTAGTRSVTAKVAGEPDSASTSCPNLTAPGAKLSSGTWSAVVSYASSSVSGKSAPVS